MRHSVFKIGTEFLTATGRWRCTDVGTRTIAAIKLDLDHDPSWYSGPPYAVAEHVFDEDSLEACEPAPPDAKFDDTGKYRLITRERASRSRSPFDRILAIDYTVIFARHMPEMRRFYGELLGFRKVRELSENWVEYQIGSNTLTLAKPTIASDAPTLMAALRFKSHSGCPSPKLMPALMNWCGTALICCCHQPTRALDIALCFFETQMEICWRFLPIFDVAMCRQDQNRCLAQIKATPPCEFLWTTPSLRS